jgi:hypothetical protein
LGHDPGLEEKRKQARVKGGKGKSKTARARKLLMSEFESWDGLIDRAAADTYRGMMAPNIATAIASLAGAKVKLFETSVRLWEASEAKDKLAELEAKLEELTLGAGNQNGYRVGVRNGFSS